MSTIPSVGRSVRKVYYGKTADWILMPFGVVTEAGPGTDVLDEGDDHRRQRNSFGDEFGRPIVTDGDFVA